jgi:hypothetical protein
MTRWAAIRALPEHRAIRPRASTTAGIAVARDRRQRIEPRLLRPAHERGMAGPRRFVREPRQKRRQIGGVRVPVRDWPTQAVLLLVALHGRLHHAQHGELVAGESPQERLDGDPSGFEDGAQRRPRQPSRRAVDVQRSRARRHPPLVQDDLVARDPPHVAQTDDVLDPAEQRQLGLADHRAAEHGRRDRGIDAEEQPLRLEAREPLHEPRDEALLPHVFAAGEIPDASAGQKPAMHHVREVRPDLVRAGQLVVAGIRPRLVDGVLPERHRADAIEGRRLVEADVGIGIDPAPAGRAATVDDGHRRIGVREQRVGERHPGGPGTHHETVGFDCFVHLRRILAHGCRPSPDVSRRSPARLIMSDELDMRIRRLALAETAITLIWLLAVIVACSDAGMPYPQWMLLFGAFVVLAAWWGLRGTFLLTSRPARTMPLSWLPGPAMLLAGLLAANTGWLLSVRLAASASALRGRAPELRAVPSDVLRAHPRRVGLFRVHEVTQFGDELRFLTNECGLVDQCGVVYSPGGRPPNRGEDSFTHLYGPWWHWYQSW